MQQSLGGRTSELGRLCHSIRMGTLAIQGCPSLLEVRPLEEVPEQEPEQNRMGTNPVDKGHWVITVSEQKLERMN